MKTRYSLCLLATAAFLGSAGLARAADHDTTDADTIALDTTSSVTATTTDAPASGTVPAISTAAPTVAAVRPAMAEVFRPAPLPGEDERAPTRQVADAGPNLHPDVLGMHERSDGALGNTDLAYNRNERMKPAGGMSLNIPMQ